MQAQMQANESPLDHKNNFINEFRENNPFSDALLFEYYFSLIFLKLKKPYTKTEQIITNRKPN